MLHCEEVGILSGLTYILAADIPTEISGRL